LFVLAWPAITPTAFDQAQSFSRFLSLKPDLAILSAQRHSPDEVLINWSSLNNTIVALRGADVQQRYETNPQKSGQILCL
jgi:hypothetical protein